MLISAQDHSFVTQRQKAAMVCVVCSQLFFSSIIIINLATSSSSPYLPVAVSHASLRTGLYRDLDQREQAHCVLQGPRGSCRRPWRAFRRDGRSGCLG